MNDYLYSDLIKQISKFPNSSVFYTKRTNSLEPKKPTGLTLNKRNTSTLKYPFVKIYDKHRELLERSQTFSNAFNIQCDYNLKRVEITLKNKRFFDKYHLTNKLEVLNTPQSILFNIIVEHFNKSTLNTFLREKTSEEKKKPTPIDKTIQRLVNELIQNGYTLKNVYSTIQDFNDLYSGNTKTRIKDKLRIAYKSSIKAQQVENIRLTPTDAFIKPRARDTSRMSESDL
jgi:hypothetical protein